MTRAYAEIAFTREVIAAQEAWGTAEDCAQALRHDIDPHSELVPAAAAFVAIVNTAFISTVSSNGWPYVQHRGGERGFIRVLDKKTLLMPDHEGNGQMLTVGNLTSESKCMLLLMDYVERRRLKLWGRARVLCAEEVTADVDRAIAPRWIEFRVEAFNFNCPSYIPQMTVT
ncbi:MAG: pyridoxamine 5'-phosphate oxidase family protein [Casimicrobium sp.]